MSKKCPLKSHNVLFSGLSYRQSGSILQTIDGLFDRTIERPNSEQDFSMRFVIDNVAFMRIRINPAAL